jgi:hypothetical protein
VSEHHRSGIAIGGDPEGRTVDVKQFADASLGGIDFLVDPVGGEVAVIRPSKKTAPPA